LVNTADGWKEWVIVFGGVIKTSTRLSSSLRDNVPTDRISGLSSRLPGRASAKTERLCLQLLGLHHGRRQAHHPIEEPGRSSSAVEGQVCNASSHVKNTRNAHVADKRDIHGPLVPRDLQYLAVIYIEIFAPVPSIFQAGMRFWLKKSASSYSERGGHIERKGRAPV